MPPNRYSCTYQQVVVNVGLFADPTVASFLASQPSEQVDLSERTCGDDRCASPWAPPNKPLEGRRPHLLVAKEQHCVSALTNKIRKAVVGTGASPTVEFFIA